MVEQLTDGQLLMHHQSLNHGFAAPQYLKSHILSVIVKIRDKSSVAISPIQRTAC
jgi:hypothetical protein